MDSTDLVPILVGGGVATLAGVIAKFLLDRQKDKYNHVTAESKQKHEQTIETANQDNEWHKQEFERLGQRITVVEEENKLCRIENATLSKALGLALGRIDGLTITVQRLDATNSKRAAEATAELAAEKAKVVIDSVAEKAGLAIETVTEKAVEKVEQTTVVVDGSNVGESIIEGVKKTVDVIDEKVTDVHDEVLRDAKK